VPCATSYGNMRAAMPITLRYSVGVAPSGPAQDREGSSSRTASLSRGEQARRDQGVASKEGARCSALPASTRIRARRAELSTKMKSLPRPGCRCDARTRAVTASLGVVQDEVDTKSGRAAPDRGCAVRRGPASSVAAAGCGPEPASDSSRPRTTARGQADSCRVQRCRVPSR